jgi:hypothetical protein
MAVNAGWGEDLGQAVEELEGSETQGGATGGVGLGQDVENLVRAAADQVEPFEGKGRPGRTSASRRCPRMSRSRPSRSVASMRTLPFRLKPPPWSQPSMSSVSWGSRRPWGKLLSA